MPIPSDTAYPFLKPVYTERELREIYTPTEEERQFAEQHTSGKPALVALLVLLKTFARLGYPLLVHTVPPMIVTHIAQAVGCNITTADLLGYDTSGTRRRHLKRIRERLKLVEYGTETQQAMEQAMREAASSKDDVVDLINIAIEAFDQQHYELPAFSTFERAAKRIRAEMTSVLHTQITAALTDGTRASIDRLFVVDPDTGESPWNTLKADPENPTLTHFEDLMKHATWLQGLAINTTALDQIPEVKIQRFATEALALDANRMKDVQARKRYTLALSLVRVQRAQALDDVAQMFTKRMLRVHQQAKDTFDTYQQTMQERVNRLILALRNVTAAFRTEGSVPERMAAMTTAYGGKEVTILGECEAHLAVVTNTSLPFLRPLVSRHRAHLFRFLRTVALYSPHQDTALADAVHFLAANESRTGEYLVVGKRERRRKNRQPVITPLVDLSWMSDTWWRIVTGHSRRTIVPERVYRQHFEECVFSNILWDLKTGDLYVKGSDRFANTWAQGISWDEYADTVDDYGKMLGFPVEGADFVTYLKDWLAKIAWETDAAFPQAHVTIENGEPVIHKPKRKKSPAGLKYLEKRLAAKLEPVGVLDMMADVQHWLNWCKAFGPLSGYESKLEDATERQMLTVFTYGTHVGPAQMERSFADLNARQIAWVHHEHMSEEKLDTAITRVIDGYTKFALPRRWGTGKRAAADGTKWEIHTHNLLAEYHIRHGGYGGVGYYHVSDTYIALFSRFIPCGVWEAVYILDGLLKNDSAIKPEEVSGDTQAQNTVVFDLSHLLGIRLMPRIRQWKRLTLYRPNHEDTYEHINGLFSADIDWDLIATHLPDMLRIVLSIKTGTITASTILGKLNTYSHKNKLFLAFQELGRVIRTGFLLQYLGDPELRATIQQATNKCESFHHFAKWVAFGNAGIIPTNNRREMRKYIKYNHLLANLLIFANVALLSQALTELVEEGHVIDMEAVAMLSPYITQHIIRFGRYQMNRDRRPKPIIYDVPLPDSETASELAPVAALAG
jgi:TnpA family transposase